MFSRVFVRIVLVAIIAAMAWSLSWTWTAAEFQNLAQRVALSIVESSVLLAALSLLIESFLSFTNLEVKRGSWKYFLFGFTLIDFDETTNQRLPSVNVRTCTMFGVRSFVLSVAALMTAMVITISFLAIRKIVLFFANPHMPSIDWLAAGAFVSLIAGGLIISVLFIAGIEWFNEKLANAHSAVRAMVWVLGLSVLFSLAMSVAHIISPIDNSPLYVIFFTALWAALLIAAFIGVVLAISYGVYRSVGHLSQKHSVLRHAWNQLCPIRTINFRD